jgi:hypothetical protein
LLFFAWRKAHSVTFRYVISSKRYNITGRVFVFLAKYFKKNLTQSRRDAKIAQRKSLKNALRLSGFAVKNYNLIRANPRHPRYPRSILVAALLR